MEGRATSGLRLTLYYVVLVLAVAAVAAVVIPAGEDKQAPPPLAGGYDVQAADACLGEPPAPPPPDATPLPSTAPAQPTPPGPSFDVKQSGQFLNPQHAGHGRRPAGLDDKAGPGGARQLSGEVDCVDGSTEDFDGTATPGEQATIAGDLGNRPVEAVLTRDPPDPGALKPRAPGSIAGLYKLSPRSTCFGGTFELTGGGDSYDVEARGKALGSIAYAKDTEQYDESRR